MLVLFCRVFCFFFLLSHSITFATSLSSTSNNNNDNNNPTHQKIPLIIDTDIGTNLDDSWAISWILARQDLFDVRLIITATDNTIGRTKTIAKYLDRYSLKTKIPIAVGVQTSNASCGRVCVWASDVDLDEYVRTGGTIYYDGVLRVFELLLENPKTQFLALAPMTNFESLLARFPYLVPSGVISAENQHMFGMFGGIHYCYSHKPSPGETCREYNVYANISAAQAWVKAPWTKSIAPLDTCSSPMTVMRGDFWTGVLEKANATTTTSSSSTFLYPWLNTMIESFWAWCGPDYKEQCKEKSDTLYDPTAAFLMFTGNQFLNIEQVSIVVTNKGELKTMTNGKDGSDVGAALSWKNMTQGPFTMFNMMIDSICSPRV